MDKSSTADLPDFLRGVAAVLDHMPELAVLADAEGRILYGNDPFRAEAAAADGSLYPGIPRNIVRDALGTSRGGFHALTLPSGRRTGVSCKAIRDGRGRAGHVLIREEAHRAVVAKFATAQEGLLKSRVERDRARANEQRLKANEQRLRAEANHWRLLSMSDRLTGLYNATGFRDRVTTALKSHDFGALVYADLNGFKQVNDTLGHLAGDDLLREIGQSLQAAIRGGDLAGRLGGDEFAVYLPNCPPDQLAKVVDRLRETMTRRIPVSQSLGAPRQILSISPAIGSALFPEDEKTLDDLLRRADARMYADKATIKEDRRKA